MNTLSNILINTKNIPGLNFFNSKSLNKSLDNTEYRNDKNERNVDELDMDINNYSVEDLLAIFNLIDNPTIFQVKDVANNLISCMKLQGRHEMALFFEKAKEKLINALEIETDESELDYSEDDDDDEDISDCEISNLYIKNKSNNTHSSTSSSSSLIGGDEWWSRDNPIKAQHSREPPQYNHNNNNNLTIDTTNSMLKYEKNILLERLKLTEMKLKMVIKENKKLKNKIKMMK